MNFWDSELKIVTCENFKNGKYSIYMLPKVNQKIDILMGLMTNIEWSAYLLGDINHKQKIVYCYDLILPLSQYNTVGNVDDIEMDTSKEYIGVIHSHHMMGAFFSGPDDSTINKNHTVSIVVSNNTAKPIAAVVRGKTMCGSLTMDESPIIKQARMKHIMFNSEEFIAEVKEKIPHMSPSDIIRTPSILKNEFDLMNSLNTVGNYEYGIPFYRNSNTPLATRYPYRNVNRKDNIVYKAVNASTYNTDDDSIAYTEILQKIRTDSNFKDFIFKELLHEKSLLKKFKDVIITSMISNNIINGSGRSKRIKDFKQKINDNNKKWGKIFH